MRRTLHWDFENDRHTCWVSCVLEFEVSKSERDRIDYRDYWVSGDIELIDVTVMAFEGYDDGGHTRYRLTREQIALDWLVALDDLVTRTVIDDIENGGPISDEMWSYA
jgi:hypothetical protein